MPKTQVFHPYPYFSSRLSQTFLRIDFSYSAGHSAKNARIQMEVMMERMSKPRKATGMRRAGSYVPVVADSVDHNSYPSKISSTIGAIHDVGYYQSMMSNSGNYSQDSQFDVVEVINDKIVERSIITDPECQSYLNVRTFHPPHAWHGV
jgi:hypothetical protein